MLMKSFRLLGFERRLYSNVQLESSRFLCSLAKMKEEKKDLQEASSEFEKFRFKYQDLLPTSNVKWRNVVREKLERRDMLRRRNVIHIPEFYVGSIMAVTSSDKHAVNKTARFVGICIMKESSGLHSKFILRNVVDQQGVEILYHIYSPVIRKIEVLKLEKRLDEELFYLRDAPNEFSTFPFDMKAHFLDENAPIPVNTLKVPLNPRPWLQRYERMNLKGVILPELPERFYEKAKMLEKPWEQYDIMDQYRKNIPEEEQKDIFDEIYEELKALKIKHRIGKKKRLIEKPKSQTRNIF